MAKNEYQQNEEDYMNNERKVLEEVKREDWRKVLKQSMPVETEDDENGEMFGEDEGEDRGEEEDGGVDELCPKPAPRKGRASKKKIVVDEEECAEEVKELCLIIRSAIKNPLIFSKNPVNSGAEVMSPVQKSEATQFVIPDYSDCGPMGEPQNTLQIVVFNPPGGSASSQPILDTEYSTEGSRAYILYKNLRYVLDEQSYWLREKQSAHFETPSFGEKLCEYYLGKNTLGKQLYYEHLSWLAIESKKSEDRPISSNGVLAWLPDFQNRYRSRYSELTYDGRPGSHTALDYLLRIATSKAHGKLLGILSDLITAREAMMELKLAVERVALVKYELANELEMTHDMVHTRSFKMDEHSLWGMKPIKLALEPPYFKTIDAMLAAPIVPETRLGTLEYSQYFYKKDKQKWTTKDLQQLKVCIKEVVVSKKLGALRDRYETLMADCLRRYDEEMNREGRYDVDLTGPGLPQIKKRRGRPKKSELELTSKYGVIYPILYVYTNGMVVRTEVTPQLLSQWRTHEEKMLKSKSYEEIVDLDCHQIDWNIVANKMILKSRKNRSGEDCELAFKHEVHPRVNDKRWGIEESKRLKDIYTRVKEENDWVRLAEYLNSELAAFTGQKLERTPYQCFFRIRNRIEPPKKLEWTDDLDQHVINELAATSGNWRLVTSSMNNEAASKRQIIERYKKSINPILRNGAFTRVEDCLLLLTIEKLKPFLQHEGHFGCLLSYLPWRCETTWRDRANNLFSDWIVPWTLEEDQMLLQLAESMDRNWQKISEEFTSFKNRKGCLTRYKILMRRLEDERFNNSLEAYHEAYSMTRYNVFQYKHLKEILELLEKVKTNPLPPQHQNFIGLLRNETPSEVRLQHMLLAFDRDILASTIASLTRYIKTRDDYWENWISKHGQRKRTFDRRTFHPENPQSVASALHIRGLELIPKERIRNITDFEEEIYKFLARFKRTKAIKEDADRPYIPDAKTLAEWPTVSRLIATSTDDLEEAPVKRKWESMKQFSVVKSGRGKKITVTRAGPFSQPKNFGKKRKILAQLRKKRVPKAPEKAPAAVPRKRGRRPASKPDSTLTASTEDGYILIPPDVKLQRNRKPWRKVKVENEIDPDFEGDAKFGLSLKNEGVERRRSGRILKRRCEAIDTEEEDMDVDEF